MKYRISCWFYDVEDGSDGIETPSSNVSAALQRVLTYYEDKENNN